MKQLILAIFILSFSLAHAQRVGGMPIRNQQPLKSGNQQNNNDLGLFATQKDTAKSSSFKFEKTTIDQYKIITHLKDTIYVDTTLSIKAEYKHNYLRKDLFGLLPFANVSNTYNTLYFGLNNFSALPNFGVSNKHFAYIQEQDINYYNVPTPVTELYYKSVSGKGQTLDAFVTGNLNKNLNIGIGYKGLRSQGKYFNDLASNGIFKVLASYNSTDKRYYLKTHITSQNFKRQENGGLTNLEHFELGEGPYSDRARADVYLENANSLFKGNRYHIDHSFKLSKSNPNSLVLHHKFNYENKSYKFNNPDATTRFGESYASTVSNKSNYNRLYNQAGVSFKHSKYGDLKAYVEDINFNIFYPSYLYTNQGLVPNNYSERINTVGANYFYQIKNWKLYADAQIGVNGPSTSQIVAKARYQFLPQNTIELGYENMSKIPDLNFKLHQSSYKSYNWYNDFANQKINSFYANLATKWINLDAKYQVHNNYLFFANTNTNLNANGLPSTLTIKPFQYQNSISYLSLKANREFSFGKFGSDHTFLYQKVDQNAPILNVPEFVTRNSIFYNNHFFKKALYLQTGVTFSYFTKYFANDYNPILGEMTVQNTKEIGDYPVFDYFLNAKIKTFRIFLKAENVNAIFSKQSNYYSAPNYPYRDFTIRFGVTWFFFS
nr:putative porin [uncultured Flavobacterium sp.]